MRPDSVLAPEICASPYQVTIGLFLGARLPRWLIGKESACQCTYLLHLTPVRSLGWEDPLEQEMATHSSILAWRIPWTEEHSPWGLQESDTTWHSTAHRTQRTMTGHRVKEGGPLLLPESFLTFTRSQSRHCSQPPRELNPNLVAYPTLTEPNP